MKSKSLLYKILVLFTMVLVVNQMACNNASFDKTDGDKGQTVSERDRGRYDDDDDGGKTVSCDEDLPALCDVDGSTVRKERSYDGDSCNLTRYTFTSYDYAISTGMTKYPIYDENDRRVAIDDVDFLDGELWMDVTVDGDHDVGFSVSYSQDVVIPNKQGRVVEIRFCLK